ncbi:hypothetical protein [Paenisporosarcina sp. NPDC076898]|uniref:hypothetical protein n=1 Tax=unclassified Paenisporosarcina TaxID=2642018 RepID=UPI003D020738
MDFFELIFFPFVGIIVPLIYIIFSKNNKRLKILVFSVILGVYCVYYFIGYLFDTNILNAITFRKHGFSINIIGFVALVATSVLVLSLIQKYIDKRKDK